MGNQKSRLLYIQRFLETQTDETHPVTIPDILAYLDGLGIQAGRKTVADDIALLTEAGVDVVCNKGKPNRYFIGSRLFELPEPKLLADAVQASRFISPRKSETLIGNLAFLAGVHQAGSPKRQLCVEKQVKPNNEEEKQVCLEYYDYTRNKKKVYKHNGKVYRFSPYGLIM